MFGQLGSAVAQDPDKYHEAKRSLNVDRTYGTIIKCSKSSAENMFGCNCGNGPEEMTKVLEQMITAGPEKPLMAQSNAGVPELVDGEVRYLYPPEKMVAFARDWIDRGVSVIGSCCGSTANTTRLLRQMVDSLPERTSS